MTRSDPPAPRPDSVRDVVYKGEPLDAERGPGLGCFRFQLVVLAVLIVLTPLSVLWTWPPAVSAALLIAVIILLFLTGQTIIFLLRLIAADRRAAGRRRPLASRTPTVGELEDRAERDPAPGDPDGGAGGSEARDSSDSPNSPDEPGGPSAPSDDRPVRQ